jgi:hypothetical protein
MGLGEQLVGDPLIKPKIHAAIPLKGTIGDAESASEVAGLGEDNVQNSGRASRTGHPQKPFAITAKRVKISPGIDLAHKRNGILDK